MAEVRKEVPSAFRAAGLRLAPRGHAVLEFLVRRPARGTAGEILAAIPRCDPPASRAAVYNNPGAPVRAALVRERAGEGKAARFDATLRRHRRFCCEQGGAAEDTPGLTPRAAAPNPVSGRRAAPATWSSGAPAAVAPLSGNER